MTTSKSCIRVLVTAALVAASLVTVGPAAAGQAKCGRGLTLDRIETKTCPATPQRPAITLERACCENKQGRVHCQAFKHCPKKSPS